MAGWLLAIASDSLAAQECPVDVTVDGTVTGAVTYRATGSIRVSTGTVVTTGAHLSLRAGETLIFEDDLAVASTSRVDAAVDSEPCSAVVEWGAVALGEGDRPDRTWLELFPSEPTVVAGSSIESAIDSCDGIVGNAGYCVVEVGDTTLTGTEYLSRSRTKIIGAAAGAMIESSGDGPFFEIGSDLSRITIEGLDLAGHTSDEVFGIIVYGDSIDRLAFVDNSFSDFEGLSNAHGIAVFGTGGSEATAVRHVVIEGNTMTNMKTGSSESLAVNGNVTQWEIRDNVLTDLNNIGIDAIGGEGTAPTTVDGEGRTVPGPFDAARFGFIEGNQVTNMSTVGNPAYGGVASWAAGIYVDGGRWIRVADNTVTNSAWAYEVGAENCLISEHITLEGNSAVDSDFGDLVLGGYAEVGFEADPTILCDPLVSNDDGEGHGSVRYLTVVGNDFLSTGTEEDVVLPQFRTTNSCISAPGISASRPFGDGSAPGDGNAIRIDCSNGGAGSLPDHRVQPD